MESVRYYRIMRDPRLENLADVIVNYSAGVKRGQIVRISGPAVASPLVDCLIPKSGGCRRAPAGSHVAGRIVGDLSQDRPTTSSSGSSTRSPGTRVETIDVSIGIWADENTKALSNVDPKRMGTSQAARKPIMDIFMKRAAEGSLKLVRHAVPLPGVGPGRGNEPCRVRGFRLQRRPARISPTRWRPGRPSAEAAAAGRLAQ